LKQRPNRDGYLCVTLHDKPRRQTFLVSRLVCEAFHGPPPDRRSHAAHGDGDRTNNSAANLRWASKAENEADKAIHGTRLSGERHPNSKLTTSAIHAIRSDSRTLAVIGAEHGISESHVSQIKRKVIWADA
jgi:hypothetical protein